MLIKTSLQSIEMHIAQAYIINFKLKIDTHVLASLTNTVKSMNTLTSTVMIADVQLPLYEPNGSNEIISRSVGQTNASGAVLQLLLLLDYVIHILPGPRTCWRKLANLLKRTSLSLLLQ